MLPTSEGLDRLPVSATRILNFAFSRLLAFRKVFTICAATLKLNAALHIMKCQEGLGISHERHTVPRTEVMMYATCKISATAHHANTLQRNKNRALILRGAC